MDASLIPTVLLRYRVVRLPGRRGGPLLAGLAAGAVLVGALVTVTPVASIPTALQAALGTPLAATSEPTTSEPATPTTTRRLLPLPLPTLAPTTGPVPATGTGPTTAPPTTSSRAPAGPAAAVVAATNAERAEAGCDALEPDSRIAAAARGHSADMAENGYFAHDSQDGRDFADRIRAQGYDDPAGENIARGQASAAEVVADWMDSPGHRQNILDCSFATIGVGHNPRGDYWTQDFGR